MVQANVVYDYVGKPFTNITGGSPFAGIELGSNIIATISFLDDLSAVTSFSVSSGALVLDKTELNASYSYVYHLNVRDNQNYITLNTHYAKTDAGVRTGFDSVFNFAFGQLNVNDWAFGAFKEELAPYQFTYLSSVKGSEGCNDTCDSAIIRYVDSSEEHR